MTIKNTADGDAVTTETMADRLRYVQTENWRKLRYTDENEEAAWEVYNDSLFLQPKTEEAAAAAAAEEQEKKADGERDLEDLVPRFGATWGDKQMLEAVSGIVKSEAEPQPAAKPEPKAEAPAVPDEATRPKARPRGGGAAAPAPRRGGRAKASSKAINID